MIFSSWRDSSISRYVLGTAQLGLDYGVARQGSRPDPEKSDEIIRVAAQSGINAFDTAQKYGDSEEILGKAFCGRLNEENNYVITKLEPSLDPTDEGEIRAAVQSSLQRLKVRKIWGLLLHNEDWLDVWNAGLGKILVGLKREELVHYLGVSVYTHERAAQVLKNVDMDMVQVPANAWDMRMQDAGIFDQARARDKLCFVRSVYLQGLLTMDSDAVTRKLPVAGGAAERWDGLARELEMDRKTLALRFSMSFNCPLVIGAETTQQVDENVRILESGPLHSDVVKMIGKEMRKAVDEEIINPSLWPVR